MSLETGEGLPDGWVETTFGELNVYRGKNLDPADYPSETFELYSVPNFPKGVPEYQLGESIGSTKQTVEPNDVLVCKINPRINRVWKVDEAKDKRQIGSSEWIVFRVPETNPDFFKHYFQGNEFRDQLCADLTGVGGSLTRAQPSKVATFEIPLPPLAEQVRIADKLDALLSRVDAGRERLERVPKLIKRFRQSVLSAAVSGELTREWRGGRDAEWEETDIESVAEIGTGSTPLRSNSEYFDGGDVPWITSAATSQEFIKVASEYVTSLAVKEHRLKVFAPGTLLVAMYGEGKTRGQVAELTISATINQACAAITVNETKSIRNFVKVLLLSNYLEMRKLAEGGNQPNLNLSKIKEFAFLLPTLPEQAEIVRRVEALFAIADRLEARCKAASTHYQRLTPALLSKAFRGELVEQDPTDEPASVLLERIQAQRAAAGAAKKPAGRGRRSAVVTPEAEGPGKQAEKKRRGKPRKVATENAALPRQTRIPIASSYEEAVRLLEAQGAARAGGTRQGELFGSEREESAETPVV